MNTAVSYAYVNTAEQRPSLQEQFVTCRNYAEAHGYEIVGEFNDINEPDHEATGAGIEAARNAINQLGARVLLVYRPAPAVFDQLNGLGATVEDVAAAANTPATL